MWWTTRIPPLACAAAIAIGWVSETYADPVIVTTVTVTTPISIFEGTGTGNVPLAPGYAEVPSTIATISESASGDSLGVTTLEVQIEEDPFTGLPVNVNVHVSSVFSLYFDVSLTDPDPAEPNFVPGIPATLTPLSPLVITTEGTVDAAAILAALLVLPPDATDEEKYNAILMAATGAVMITPSDVTPAKYALNVDINMAGGNDLMSLSTTDLDPATLDLDFMGGDLDDLLSSLIPILGSGPSSIDLLTSVSVSGLNLTFSGNVFDPGSDPPFTLSFENVTLGSPQVLVAEIPEPSSLLLLFVAGLSLILAARRRKAA